MKSCIYKLKFHSRKMFVNLKTAAHVSILVPFLIILMEYHD